MDVVAALGDTQRAFDGVAPDYHRANVDNPLLSAMRVRLWRAVDRYVPRGADLLDLGCGPGTDEEHFAARGYRVTALDWSPAMVQQTRWRIRGCGLEGRVEVRQLGIHELDRLAPARFDAVCSNLGPLNCVPDLDAAAALIADRVRIGGVLVASVIGRICPWEIALYATRRDWSRVTVRFAATMMPVPLEGQTVWTRYYWPREFERAFARVGFERVVRRGLGVFVPPPYMHAFAHRHRRFSALLQHVDDAAGAWPGVRAIGDHFLTVMRRV